MNGTSKYESAVYGSYKSFEPDERVDDDQVDESDGAES